MKGFKQFIMRGNVLDLAVAVVMGAAFGGGRHRPGKGSADTVDRSHRRETRLLCDYV